jgi:hypothetical protein
VYKDWWDPGHDPNRTEVTIDRFLKGELHDEITRELGSRVLEEALETVECLTSGGPGVAEPPDWQSALSDLHQDGAGLRRDLVAASKFG